MATKNTSDDCKDRTRFKAFVMENCNYHITSVFSRLDFPGEMLGKLASVREGYKPCEILIPEVLETIQHSSAETYTSGDVEMIFLNDDMEIGYLSIPVVTPFVITCTKGNQQDFNLDWCTSLS
jgi:hypothetical protein